MEFPINPDKSVFRAIHHDLAGRGKRGRAPDEAWEFREARKSEGYLGPLSANCRRHGHLCLHGFERGFCCFLAGADAVGDADALVGVAGEREAGLRSPHLQKVDGIRDYLDEILTPMTTAPKSWRRYSQT